MANTQIVLVNFNQLWNEGLSRLLQERRIDVASTTSTDWPLGALDHLRPVLFLYRLDEEIDEAVTWVRRVKAQSAQARVVCLSTRLRAAHLVRLMATGADGYLTDTITARALKHSLQLVMSGEKVFPSHLVGFLADARARPAEREDAGSALGGLTHRECVILRYVLKGVSNKGIARALNLTEGSVKMHLKTLFKKLGVSNRTQAAVWGMANSVALAGVDVETPPVLLSRLHIQGGAVARPAARRAIGVSDVGAD